MEAASLTSGIVLLGLGAVLGVWKKKRKFDRTNFAGIEQFSSFSGKAISRFIDGALFLLSAGLLLAGLLIVSTVCEDTFGWMVLVPIYTVMLLVVI